VKLLISVTAEDIVSGEPMCSGRCPIARALDRAAGRPRWLSVSTFDASYSTSIAHYAHCELPDVAKRFIRAFDHGHHVEPFECELVFEESA